MIMAYAMHINKLIMIAENPRVITRLLKKGIESTISLPWETGFFASILLKKINNIKAILQIRVNRDKKEITFIN
jgi:hypothetical protein